MDHEEKLFQKLHNKKPICRIRPNQKDTDSLPPYNELDKILYLLIEKEFSVKAIVKRGSMLI